MAAALKTVTPLRQSPSASVEAATSAPAGRHTVAPLGLADDPRLRGLSAAAVGLYPYLLLLRQQWVIRGLSVLRGTSVEAVLAAEIPLADIAGGLAELERAGLVLVDRAALVLYVPAGQALTAQAPSSVRQVEQLEQQLAGLPASAVCERARADLLALCERAEVERVKRRGRRSVDVTLLERVRAALGVRLVAVPEPEDLRGQLTLPGMAVMSTPDFIDFEQACEPAAHLREGAPSQSVAKRAGGVPLSILPGGQDDRGGSTVGIEALSKDAEVAPGARRADPGAAGVSERRDHFGLRLVGAGSADIGAVASAAAVPTFGARWRAVAERCPKLAGASRSTDSGLSHAQERKLCIDVRAHALTDEDLLLVADYVKAGGFAWAGQGARERVVSDIVEALAQARQWDSEGRGPVRKAGGRAQHDPTVGLNQEGW